MAKSEDQYKGQKIDKEFYDQSDYFDNKGDILTDLNTPFQKYRISNVTKIYTPDKSDRVLDIGCGWGTFEFVLAPSVKEIVGLDFSEKSIEICNELLAQKQLDNVKFVCADAADTGLESDSFDLIISADFFEHIYPEDYERVMDECVRLLKPGGKLAIWTPNRGHILEIMKNNDFILKRDISHVDYKSMQTLLDGCTGRGMKILRSYYAESHLPVMSVIEKMFLNIIPIFRRRNVVLAEKL